MRIHCNECGRHMREAFGPDVTVLSVCNICRAETRREIVFARAALNDSCQGGDIGQGPSAPALATAADSRPSPDGGCLPSVGATLEHA